MQHSIWIPKWYPPSTNRLAGKHWAESGRVKKQARLLIGAMARHHRTPKATGRRRVGLMILYSDARRKCDPDNYWKALLDALKHAKLIVNDDETHVVLETPVFQRCPPDCWGTRITLTEVDYERDRKAHHKPGPK